ncbi:MAG TPA: fimbria/pilus periplasmic chaperone [Xanthomonadales bacterium]|nr:fimbria/pilus periplasmic chaperone [Xanthomonadales bacterium]
MQHFRRTLGLIRNTTGILSILVLSTNLVLADDFVMQPSSVSLAQKKPTAVVTLTNSGSEDKVLKIQVMSFTDENGREQLTPSTRLIVHPAQLTLKSGTSQAVKVGIRLSGPLFDEENYRLVLTETQPGPKVGATEVKSVNTLSKRLALLPVTVLPPGHKFSGR